MKNIRPGDRRIAQLPEILRQATAGGNEADMPLTDADLDAIASRVWHYKIGGVGQSGVASAMWRVASATHELADARVDVTHLHDDVTALAAAAASIAAAAQKILDRLTPAADPPEPPET